MEDCQKKNLHQTDRRCQVLGISVKATTRSSNSFGPKISLCRYLAAQSQLESAKLAFHEVDKHIFEWSEGH